LGALDPSHVIGLYPNLLPEDFRKQLDYPDALPDLDGAELERGILSLIDYLTEVCRFTLTSISFNSLFNMHCSLLVSPFVLVAPEKCTVMLLVEAVGPWQGGNCPFPEF